LTLATQVGNANPSAAEVQVKCIKLFMKYNKADLALKAATNLVTLSASYHKTERIIGLFNEYSKTAEFTSKDDFSNFKDKLLA